MDSSLVCDQNDMNTECKFIFGFTQIIDGGIGEYCHAWAKNEALSIDDIRSRHPLFE